MGTSLPQRRHLRVPQPMVPMTRPTTRVTVPGPTNHVVIIGAGLSGLTAALRVRATGREVTLIESADGVGGRCRTETLRSGHGEFDADTGATVLTMPSLVEAAVASVGLRAEDLSDDLPHGWGLRRLNPAYAASFASGRSLAVHSDSDLMLAEIERFASDHHRPEGVTGLQEGYLRHRDWAEELFTTSFDNFLAADFDSILDLLSTPASTSDLGHLLALGAFGSLGRRTRKDIQDEELARVLSFQALYAGVAPNQARAVYAVIAHMDTSMGVFYPRWGIGDVPELLAAAARRSGVNVVLNQRVVGLDVEASLGRGTEAPGGRGRRALGRLGNLAGYGGAAGERISAVLLEDGTAIPADAVIATCDLPVLERILPPSTGTRRPGRIPRKLTWSPSAVVIQGTVPREVADSWDTGLADVPHAHHSISFGHAWESTFEEITGRDRFGRPRRGELMRDPSLLVTRPAVTNPERRFTGADGREYEPVSILAPTPNLQVAPLDWENITEPYTREVLTELERRGFHGLADAISIARIDTPTTWEAMGHGAGTPFALSHTLFQTGPFRPRNYPGYGISNLVLAGSSTTPGVGVPTTILSGALAARRITGGGVR